MSPRLAFALDAAVEAGRLTLAWFQGASGFELKEDASPVTAADRAAERRLRDRIESAYPHEPILGEEEGGIAARNQWVIDPIDGTKSFVCGVPLYAVLLSYEDSEGPLVGVSYFPALDWLVYAERGQGAFANGRVIRVAPQSDLNEVVVCAGGHRSMEKHGRQSGFQQIAREVMATRTWGDAYGHCMVAAGRAHAMIDPVVSKWDLSAVNLIVEEAGGQFTDFAGGRLPQSEAISSNGVLHDWLLEQFRG
ncbi:MAG: hypothetical protein IT363_15180 [Methanoregulaceae archaeon]|nr:hypothetical protein [Methanoregulaceae archaeon]